MKLKYPTKNFPLTVCSFAALITLAACDSDSTSQIEEDLANGGTATITISADDDVDTGTNDVEAPVTDAPEAADVPTTADDPVVADDDPVVVAPTVLPSCASALSDSDGDGFGFENNQSCVVDASSQPAPVTPEPTPPVDQPVAEVPVVEEPVAEVPAVEEPVAEVPVVEEPVAEVPEEPVVEEPVAEAPVVEEPVAEAPVVEEPVVEAPVVEEPVAAPPVISTAFGTIQSTVFTPICSECHGPAFASAGLRLDEAVSFSAIVGVASTEVPTLSRIEPGDPDNSYLIQKIEGTQAIGAQMPLGGPPLPPETMAFFREWVSNGALPDGAVIEPSDVAAFAPRVASASVDQNAVMDRMPESVTIVWTSPVDNSSLSDATVSLVRSGGDGTFNDGNEIAVDIYTAETENPYVTTLVTAELKPTEDNFQLRILGDGDTVARSVDAVAIDGNGNGTAGGNFVRDFVIEKP